MLQTWKSAHPQTEFAPSWNIPFWNATYPNPADIDFAREWIINNEKKIVDQFNEPFHRTHGDGGTGLGSDSLTSKYPYFNLFKLTRDLPAFKNIFKSPSKSSIVMFATFFSMLLIGVSFLITSFVKINASNLLSFSKLS